MRNTLIKAIIIAMPLSHFTAGTLSAPPLSLSGHLAVYGLCVSIWSTEGKKMKAKVTARSLPAYISFFSPLEDSQGRKPSPAPQPSAVPQELPGSTPTEALSGELCLLPLTGIQHPAPSRRRKQPVRGDLCFRKVKERKALFKLYVYRTLAWHVSPGPHPNPSR